MIFNEIKCHVNTSLGLVVECIPSLCQRLDQDWIGFNFFDQDWTRTEKLHSPLVSGSHRLALKHFSALLRRCLVGIFYVKF